MRTSVILILLALGLFGRPGPAEAQVVDGVSIMVKISMDPSLGGTAIGAASGSIDGAPSSIERASWTDTHSDSAPLFEGGVGVRAGTHVEVLGLFNYGRAGANTNVIGEAGGADLVASLDDYKFWGLEGGISVRPASREGPYATFTAGFRRVSEIQARLRVDSTTQTVAGYEASTVPSFALGGGMS